MANDMPARSMKTVAITRPFFIGDRLSNAQHWMVQVAESEHKEMKVAVVACSLYLAPPSGICQSRLPPVWTRLEY
jgi:hypothetical protein